LDATWVIAMSPREHDLTSRDKLGFSRVVEEVFRFLSDYDFRLLSAAQISQQWC